MLLKHTKQVKASFEPIRAIEGHVELRNCDEGSDGNKLSSRLQKRARAR